METRNMVHRAVRDETLAEYRERKAQEQLKRQWPAIRRAFWESKA